MLVELDGLPPLSAAAAALNANGRQTLPPALAGAQEHLRVLNALFAGFDLAAEVRLCSYLYTNDVRNYNTR